MLPNTQSDWQALNVTGKISLQSPFMIFDRASSFKMLSLGFSPDGDLVDVPFSVSGESCSHTQSVLTNGLIALPCFSASPALPLSSIDHLEINQMDLGNVPSGRLHFS